MKRAKQSKKQKKRRTLKAEKSAKRKGSRRYLPDELAEMYKPVKKPVTIRVDADILAWFQQGGRGYQTRINQALRSQMMQERK